MKNTNSLFNDAWAALSKNKAALISATTMAAMVLMVLFGPILALIQLTKQTGTRFQPHHH